MTYLIILSIYLFCSVWLSLVFNKIWISWWKGFIPFYNSLILFEEVWLKKWWWTIFLPIFSFFWYFLPESSNTLNLCYKLISLLTSQFSLFFLLSAVYLFFRKFWWNKFLSVIGLLFAPFCTYILAFWNFDYWKIASKEELKWLFISIWIFVWCYTLFQFIIIIWALFLNYNLDSYNLDSYDISELDDEEIDAIYDANENNFEILNSMLKKQNPSSEEYKVLKWLDDLLNSDIGDVGLNYYNIDNEQKILSEKNKLKEYRLLYSKLYNLLDDYYNKWDKNSYVWKIFWINWWEVQENILKLRDLRFEWIDAHDNLLNFALQNCGYLSYEDWELYYEDWIDALVKEKFDNLIEIDSTLFLKMTEMQFHNIIQLTEILEEYK